jgi:hypothetical protein
MAWNGSGTYTQTDGTYSGTGICAAQAGDGDAIIRASEMDLLFQDHATAINACLAKNGENAATANLPMGGFKHTGMAVGSAATDSATYGQTITALSFDSGTSVVTATRAAGNLTVDLSAMAAGTGGVALTGDQTVAGVKTFSDISSLVHAKMNGPVTNKVNSITSSSTPTVNTTTASRHYISVNQNMTVDFTWPTAASDTQLGANWEINGKILFRWAGASYTITLNAAMLAALDDYEIEGTHTTGSGEMSTLVYNYIYLNGTKYAQFAWVSTP